MSLILFIFYNANFVDACNLPTLLSSRIGFVDDVIALACGKTTEDNCRMLQSIHERCLEWARKHAALFAPEKYLLVHFTKAKKKAQHRLPTHPPINHNYSQPVCSCFGGYPQQKTQLTASPATYQVQADHPDKRPHNAYSLNVGRLPTGLEAALH
jgi:hypothetical protein